MGTTQPRGGFFGKFHRSTGKLNPPYIYLAYNEMWTEMFKELDNCRAGVDDFNQFGFTALHCAAKHGAVGVIDELVRRGASIDAINGKIYVRIPATHTAPITPNHSLAFPLTPSHRSIHRCMLRWGASRLTQPNASYTTAPASRRRTRCACVPPYRADLHKFIYIAHSALHLTAGRVGANSTRTRTHRAQYVADGSATVPP